MTRSEMGSETGIRVEWLTALSSIEALRERWRALEAVVTDRTVFASWDYAFNWYKSYGGTGHEQYGRPLLGAAWKGKDLVGVAPFTLWDGSLGRVSVRRVDFAGHNADAGEFLVSDAEPGVLSAFITSLKDMSELDVICLNGLDAGSDKYHEAMESAEGNGLDSETAPYRYATVDLGAGYADYCKSKSANFRRNLRRHARRVESAGDVSVERIHGTTAAGRVNEFTKRIFRVSGKSWKKGANPVHSKHHWRFYRDVIDAFSKRGMVDIAILTINGVDAAYIVGLAERGTYYDFTISFDDSFKDLYPGVYLMQELLKQLPASGVRKVVSHGDHGYKERWACEFATLNRVFLFTHGLRSTLSHISRFRLPRVLGKLRETAPGKAAEAVKERFCSACKTSPD